MSDQEQELAYQSAISERQKENDLLKDQLEGMGRLLESEKVQAKKAEQRAATLDQQLRQAMEQLSEIQKKNNVAFEGKTEAEGELDELKLFCFQVAREVGLEPGKCGTNDVLRAVRLKTKMSCHEEIGGGLIVKVKRVLDPMNQYPTVLEAAQAVMAQASRMNLVEHPSQLEMATLQPALPAPPAHCQRCEESRAAWIRAVSALFEAVQGPSRGA